MISISKPVWMCQVWTDGSHQLRFCPIMDWVCLSVKHSTKIDAQSSIQLYRDQCRDTETLTLVSLHLHMLLIVL